MTMFGPKLTTTASAPAVQYDGVVERHAGVIVRSSIAYDSVGEKNWLHLLLSGSDALLSLAIPRGLTAAVSLSAPGDSIVLIARTPHGHSLADVVEFTNHTLDELRGKSQQH